MKTFIQMTKHNNTPKYLIVHHTGGTNADPLADTSNHTFEIVRDYHISKGWDNIGYHYFIDKTGKVTQGRPDYYNGAHTLGKNNESLGIAMAGNFDLTMPTKEQVNSLKILLKNKSEEYKIPKEKIVPHRDFANKTCYGNNLSESWARDLLKIEIKSDLVIEKETMVEIPKRILVEISKYLN